MKEKVLCSIHREKKIEVVMMSGQHEIVLCNFQDVEVGGPQLVLNLVSLQDDHSATRRWETSQTKRDFIS